MEFRDVENKIFTYFEIDWLFTRLTWKDFVDRQKLGIEYNSCPASRGNGEVYNILNEKEWMFSRLKYGF